MRSITFKIVLGLCVWASLLGVSNAEEDCGKGQNECSVALGSYNIELPERADAEVAIPAVIYFHGAGGTGQRSLKNRAMVEAFLEEGYAVVAPSGLKRPNSRFGPGWSFHPDRPKLRDELAFARQVMEDASQRFNLDRNRFLMTGFSIGGSLVWYLACQDPDLAKAYAPVAGAFWRPHTSGTDCAGPIRLLHTHGWRDGTVPLEGRVLGKFRIEQGDVFYGLQLLREVNDCNNYKADQYDTKGKFWKRWWTHCSEGSALQLNLFDGGHLVPDGWAKEAVAWFESLELANKLDQAN